MKLKNETYDILKWVVQVVMPALIAFIGATGGALSWEHTEITMTLLSAATVFLGTTLGISNHNYKKEGE